MSALGRLGERYALQIRSAWSMRRQFDASARSRDECEFLPAALALRDAPAHPAPRIIAALTMTLVVSALAWAAFGKVDVVASAPGKILPAGDVKVIQSQETAVIKSIRVDDGQHVEAGDLLIDLDSTDASSDDSKAKAELTTTHAEIARAEAMLHAIDTGTDPVIGDEVGMAFKDIIGAERQILKGEFADYRSNLARIVAEIDQAQASIRQTDAELRKIEGTLPIEEHKLADYTELSRKGYVGKHDFYNEQQAVIQMRQDLAIQESKRVEGLASLEAGRKKQESFTTDARKTWLEKLHDDTGKVATLLQDAAKAHQHDNLMHLKAPTSGIVQHLAVHTVGGVVTPAQALLTIVPDDMPLMVEAIIDNQDIGFVREGQEAEVKVETFSFTRYGTLHGHVVQVANDAKQDDKLGLIFTAQVSVPVDHMQVDDRIIRLTPGMAVTAEIKTDRRRVISYVLSPLIQHASESLHER